MSGDDTQESPGAAQRALLPVRPSGRRSHSTRWLSVPPVTRRYPFAASARPSAAALRRTAAAYSLNDGSAACFSATARAPIWWLCGPPWREGKTALLTAASYSYTPPGEPGGGGEGGGSQGAGAGSVSAGRAAVEAGKEGVVMSGRGARRRAWRASAPCGRRSSRRAARGGTCASSSSRGRSCAGGRSRGVRSRRQHATHRQRGRRHARQGQRKHSEKTQQAGRAGGRAGGWEAAHYSKGLAASPAATRPLMWAMSMRR